MDYKHIYLEIIRRAKNEQIIGNRPLNIYYRRRDFKDEYFEFHHILPKSLFPKFEKIKKNLVPLTAKEHFICHKLLFKIYPGQAMAFALLKLCRKRNDMHPIKLSARSYEQLRKMLADTLSNAQKGKELPKETRIKISNALKEGYKSGKIIPPAKDKPVTAEKRKQISETLKERYKNGYKGIPPAIHVFHRRDDRPPATQRHRLVVRRQQQANHMARHHPDGQRLLDDACLPQRRSPKRRPPARRADVEIPSGNQTNRRHDMS